MRKGKAANRIREAGLGIIHEKNLEIVELKRQVKHLQTELTKAQQRILELEAAYWPGKSK